MIDHSQKYMIKPMMVKTSTYPISHYVPILSVFFVVTIYHYCILFCEKRHPLAGLKLNPRSEEIQQTDQRIDDELVHLRDPPLTMTIPKLMSVVFFYW